MFPEMFMITSLYLDVRYLRTKGQVISKGIFSIFNSSKKTYEEIRLNYYDTSGRLVFVRFLEEFEDTKRHFEINWPLVIDKECLHGYFH